MIGVSLKSDLYHFCHDGGGSQIYVDILGPLNSIFN